MLFADERGAATAEQIGLTALVAAIVAVAAASLAGAPSQDRAGLGTTLARKLRCAAVGPGPCWRDPLTVAYGRPLAGAIRALAPAPAARPGPDGRGLLPVDFRRCRSASCAVAGPQPGLTASNRRVTAFVAVDDRRPAGGPVRIDYWLYRPGLGWECASRFADSARVQRLAPTALLESDVPTLVALETLDGRNQFDWAPGEEPPWRWRVESVVG